jgi:hypothetical protein
VEIGVDTTELGKISPWVNVSRLKFFEQRDAEFTDLEAPVRPVRGGDGSLSYEIHRIWGHQPHGKLPAKEYLVQWKGYDTSQMTWVVRASLLADVPALLHYDDDVFYLFLQKQKINPTLYTPRVLPTIRGCFEGLALMI